MTLIWYIVHYIMDLFAAINFALMAPHYTARALDFYHRNGP